MISIKRYRFKLFHSLSFSIDLLLFIKEKEEGKFTYQSQLEKIESLSQRNFRAAIPRLWKGRVTELSKATFSLSTKQPNR